MKLSDTKKIIGGIALAGALALTGVVGFAQTGHGMQQGQDDRERHEGRGGHEGGERRGGDDFAGGPWRNLNLTDAQKAQMKQIADQFRQNTQSLRQQMHGRRGGDDHNFGNGTFDETAVRAAAQARANAQVEMEVARARMMYQMYNVLTAEQKTQLATERQQREQRRQEWRNRQNQNPGQNQ
ncbi:MAG TPA: Spy/CpxP family protein refolding chaperone [Pyrinomonadaceae bacterium]|nr:Spy/CpxP family protein refolding chaperone [Pyrinomonadaceae bacterium]